MRSDRGSNLQTKTPPRTCEAAPFDLPSSVFPLLDHRNLVRLRRTVPHAPALPHDLAIIHHDGGQGAKLDGSVCRVLAVLRIKVEDLERLAVDQILGTH